MGAFAIAVFAVVATGLVLGAAFSGIGLALRRAFGARAPKVGLDDCFLSFWVGYGVTLLFLMLWNFVRPVGLTALLIVLVAGACGLAFARHDLRTVFRHDGWRPRWWEAGVLLVGTLWVVAHAVGDFASWDGVLYHVQAVKWAKTYAVIPGLANLHGPLAFNNSSFLYDAMVDSGWWEGRGFHIANPVLVLVALLQAAIGGLRWLRGDGRASARHCLGFFMLALVFHFGRDSANFSTDLPAGLVLVAAVLVLYRLLEASAERAPGVEDAYDVFALAVLLAAAVSIKLTTAVFAAIALPLVVVVRFRRWSGRRTALARSLTWTSLAVAVFAVALTARGIVLSGYPFFPVAVAGMPVEWRAPVEHAHVEAAYIVHTERAFTWNFIGSNWVRLILREDVNAAFIPGGLAAGAWFLWWRWRRREGVPRESLRDTWWLALPVVVAIGLWFVTAPSHRYSPPLFWSLAALCAAESQRVLWSGLSRQGRRVLAALLVAIALSPLLVERGMLRPARGPALAMLDGRVDTEVFETRSGLALHVPKKDARNPRGLPNSCWNAPLPCTPNPAPNLELRVPGRLDQGFKVQGPWEMLDFPYPRHPYFLPEWRRRNPDRGK